MPNIGNESAGTEGFDSLGNTFAGLEITMPENGSVTSITARLQSISVDRNVKACIYRLSDGAKMGSESQELSVPTTEAWYTFTFTTPVALLSGVTYVIGAASDGNCHMRFNSEASEGRTAALTYPTFDDPETLTNWDNQHFSIYATYTTGGDPTDWSTPVYQIGSGPSGIMVQSGFTPPTYNE